MKPKSTYSPSVLFFESSFSELPNPPSNGPVESLKTFISFINPFSVKLVLYSTLVKLPKSDASIYFPL